MTRENLSGLEPRGRAVLVQVDEAAKVPGSKIEIPDFVKDKTDMVEQNAVVIAVGPSAFMDEGFWEPVLGGLWRRWKIIPRAVVGETVIITRFAGYMTKGPRDGKRYRMVNDRDIFGAVVYPWRISNQAEAERKVA